LRAQKFQIIFYEENQREKELFPNLLNSVSFCRSMIPENLDYNFLIKQKSPLLFLPKYFFFIFSQF